MPGSPVTTAETHVSTLFFTEDRVLKMKKAVDNGFLDFTTTEARAAACHREVDLNRRLAPDVYLGVADLVMEGRTLEHFVVMRRLPPERRLSSSLDHPDVRDQLARIAELVARFHERADRGPDIDADATVEALAGLWRTGVEQLAPFVGEVLDRASVERMAARSSEYLSGREPLVAGRISRGLVCDGHGDLLAEDIFCMDDGPRVLDCLEFDDHLRHGDVLADVAFLAMDLERLGRPDLATHFLEAYRSASGTSWPPSFAHHLVAYRAHVRAKVACLRHAQGAADARAAARSLHDLALDHLERGRVRLVLVGGAPGTGKSTLARSLADSLGAARISSDELRREIVPVGAGPPGQLHSGRYDPAMVDLVYRTMLERAGDSLGLGEHVVLDASWSDQHQREAARRLAEELGAAAVELDCTCAPDLAARRIADRRRRGGDASEVTEQLADRLTAERDPWPEAVRIDTTGAPNATAEAAARAVERVSRDG